MSKQRNNMNVPQLRFKDVSGKDFPAWEAKLIGAVAEVTTGDKDTQNKVEDGAYPFFVRSQTVEKINSYSFDGEAILTSGDGVGVGKNFHYINGKFDFHQRVYCIHSFKNKINGKFVFHYFSEKFNKRVMQLSAKNSVDSVRRSMITDMPISIPTIEEQTKIANFLTAVDEKISQLNQKCELLTQYKKGVMQQIFSQALRFKDEDGRDFPEWEDKKLKDIFTVKYGKDYNHLEDGNIPLLGTGGVMRYVNQYLYDKPSVLIGRKGTIDKPQFIETPFWTVDTLFYTEIHDSYSPYFVYQLVSLINWYKYNEATGVPSLNTTAINNVEVRTPTDIKEQIKIANFLSAIDDKINHAQTQLAAARQYKQGLLQQMFV